MAYTIIKNKKQTEHNFVMLIRARARCALPLPLEFHPVDWLHVPINPSTAAVQDFSSWDEEAILRTLTNAIQRLGGQRKGSMLEILQYRIITDTSKMYNPRTEPRANTAMILANTTCWTDPPMVNRAIYQRYQILKAVEPNISKEPNRRILPISSEMPNNPKMAMEMFLDLIAKQKQEGNSVYKSYLDAIKLYKEVFRNMDINSLPTSCRQNSARWAPLHPRKTGSMTYGGFCQRQFDFHSVNSESSQFLADPDSRRKEELASNTNLSNPIQMDIPIVPSDDMATPREESSNISISQREAADIELELIELRSPDQQEWQPTGVPVETLSATLQNPHHSCGQYRQSEVKKTGIELCNQTKLTKKTVVENTPA